MTFAPPVQRGNFFCSGDDLFVDVGNLNRHKRATTQEITTLLRPDLKKTKTNPPVRDNKDQVAHWYEAQLIHYGLPPSKDKARAKMRLLEALNNSKLKVPSDITRMESEMKKEFATAERKAKAQYKASMTSPGLNEPPSISKKRKQSDSACNPSNIQSNRTPAKKMKAQIAESATPKMKTGSGISDATTPYKTKQTAKSSILTKRWNDSIAAGLPPPGPPPVGWHITPSGGLARDGEESPEKTKNPAKAETKPEKKPAVKKEPATRKPDVKKEPTPKKKTNAKLEPFPTSPSYLSPPPSLGLLNGIYDISCLEVSSEWPSYGRDLTLTLTLDTPALWGAYDFGMFSGVLLLPNRPLSASAENALPLTWRGRENGEGEMSFGERCTGEIKFLGGGRIEGWMSVYGQLEFTGMRRTGPGAPVRTARSMRAEWEGYNDAAYEEERVGRWR